MQSETADPRPTFIDNRQGNTLERAILAHGRALRAGGALPFGIDIATAYFNLPGFELVAEELERSPRVRLLLGAEPKPEAERPERRPGDPTEPQWTERQVREGLAILERGLAHGRDLLPFERPTDEALRRLLDLLRSGKLEVRRYERQFLHAKAFLFETPAGGFVSGSSNLTKGGLRTNLELNLGNYDPLVVKQVQAWFEGLWNEAAPYDLAAVFDRLLAEYAPYLIFLRVLYELYGGELEAEQEEEGRIALTTFQQHGIWRALRIIAKYGGVLIADGVGLGKTYTAGAIIRRYRERRQHVLLVCPAALRDSTWDRFLYEHDLLKVDCISYEQLARDTQLGGDHKHLRRDLDDYALVVIDEAHNYRNRDAQARAGVLRRLLLGQRRDVVLLSATPVNNSLWDLYHLLNFFLRQDAVLADQGINSLKERFQDAMKVDPFNLHPDMLYPVIDATTVKRTRDFIRKHYRNDTIRLPDGREATIKFPKPHAGRIDYSLEAVLPGFIGELEEALAPQTGNPKLTLARYQPERYRLGEHHDPDNVDSALVGLVRSGLLKRFESSVYAFACSTRKMAREHAMFLEGLERGVILRKELLDELSAADDEDEMEEVFAAAEAEESAENYDVEALRRDVAGDMGLLEEYARRTGAIRAEESDKLRALVEELARIAREAAEQGIDEQDARQRRKVLIFSFFADTVDWIEDYLLRMAEEDRRLAPYLGRIASVAGTDSRGGVTREAAVVGFAPESAGGLIGEKAEAAERFDLLIATDVLAEGMNLQQCRNIINYDLPWNPMRLVQRHGRIDRIGSPHDDVYLRTIFPDRELDRLLALEERVRKKLAQAAASVGVEDSPILDGAVGRQSFSETREEIEKLFQGDASLYERGGTRSAAQSGEEYRQQLREALVRIGDEIRDLPWKAGSGLARGPRRGHFFCARTDKEVALRFVPWEGADEEIVAEVGTCLRLIECSESTPRVMPQDLKEGAYDAWQRARQHIFNAWMFRTDPANLEPSVPKICREIAAFLQETPPADVDQRRIERTLQAIQAPCQQREQNRLRDVFHAEYAGHEERGVAVIEAVEELGLEPYAPPTPLPLIEPDDVRLVCWLAVEAG